MILRELIAFEAQGADAFFGEPEFESRTCSSTTDGRGVVTCLELPDLQDRPAVFSTFLMWLLADLFHDLPEVGRPRQAQAGVLLRRGAPALRRRVRRPSSTAIAQTVRLIRSKGVGVFFVTQTPTDVPDDVLAQLGNRVQHRCARTPRTTPRRSRRP